MKRIIFSCLSLALAAFLGLTTNLYADNPAPTNSTEAILRHPGFREGLVWIGSEPSEAQSASLLAILKDLNKPVWRDEVEKFLNDYPDSPWAASLHHAYASFCHRTGRTTKALEHWEIGWKLVKDDTSAKGRRLGGAILASWMEQLSSLGRRDKLRELIIAGDKWPFSNHQDREKFVAAKNAYHLMGTHPEMAFRCGTLALKAVGQTLQPTNQDLESLVNVPSPSNGFSVSALEDMANKYGLNLVAVKRTKGKELVVPSIVHWRQNHYAAIIGKTNDEYRVIDPTFGKPKWMPADVINEEASGIFLVPAKFDKPGWTRLAEGETTLVRGMGIPAYVSDGNDKGCTTVAGGAPLCNCGGMPVWWVSEPYINVWIADEPISYLTSRGEKFGFRLSYKQRDTRPTATTVPMAGWNHSWWSSLRITQTSTESDATLYMANGGEASFTISDPYDPENRLLLQYTSQGPLVVPGDLPAYYQPGWGFRIVHADGTQDIYELLANTEALDGDATVYDFLLTRSIDPNGNTTSTLNYIFTNGQYVLTSVVDYDGRTNTLGYTYISDMESEVLTSITNAYGKTAFFKYDTNANLTNIVDAQGIPSSLTYDTNGYPTSLITPYGTNLFTLYVGAEVANTNNGGGNFGGDEPPYVDRAAQITDPTGTAQLYLYQYDCTGFMATNYASSAIPTGTPIGTLDTGTGNTNSLSGVCYRNSFYWNQRQYAALSTTNFTNLVANDYLRGRMRHWLQDTNVTITITGQLSVEQAPSPDGTNGGLLMFYDYQGKPQNYVAGTYPLPSVIAWRIPGQDTHYEYDQYNYFGNITNRTTTATIYGFSTTRSFQYIYADNTYTNALSNSDTNGNFVNWATNYFTVPNLLVRVIDPNGSNIWQCAGFDGISWTNNFGSTNWEEVLSSQRVLPRYWTNEINETTAFTFTNFNKITSIQWPSGLTSTNIYNSGGFLDHTTDLQINRTRGFVYSTNGMPSTYTNELGLVVGLFWDNLLRPAGASFPDGTTISNVYTALDITAHKDRLGHWASFGYDGLRHLTSITRTNDGNVTNTTTLVWCGCGALTDIYDALTNHTAFGYDYQSRLTSIEFPDTSSLSYLYDLSGRMTNVMDGAGAYFRIGYNNQGMLSNINNNYGMIFQLYLSDALDRPVQIIGNNNRFATFFYDGLNRMTNRSWQDGSQENFVYASNGLASYQDQNGNTTYFGRDAAGRLTSVTNANTNITQLAYDPAGDVTNLIDGLIHNTGLGYNQFGWLTSIVDNSGNQSFRFYYDANGELTNRWTPGTTNITYTYDSLGNRKSISYPGAANPTAGISFAYDVLNRLTNMVDGVGTTSWTYTSNSFVNSETGPWANTAVAYLYNQRHRINLAVTSPASTLNFSNIYDAAWRLQSLVSPEGAFNYTYATLTNYLFSMPSFGPGLVSSITLPNAAVITNQYAQYTGQSRLVSTALQNYWGHVLDGYSYTYDYDGQRTSMTRSLGIATNIVTNVFDNIGQLTSWSGQEASGALRLNEQLSFTYDAAQNLEYSTNNDLGQTFTVNPLNELSTITRGEVMTVTGSTPAPASNLMVNGVAAQTYSDLTFASTNNTLNRGTNLTTFTIIATNAYGVSATNVVTGDFRVTVSFQYDTNGNQLGDETRNFVYDAENQLTNIYVTNQWMTQFGYDGLRRRRIERDFAWNGSAWVKTNEAHIVFDGLLPIQERDTNSNVLVTYTRGPDLSGSIMGAGGIGGLLARTDANGSAFYHADGAGNITALIDENQNIVARYEYDPFLRTLGTWGPLGPVNKMRGSSMPNYNGGIIGFWGRTYDTLPRRWLSKDPIGLAGGINPYPYVGNSPLNKIDPFGLQEAEGEGGVSSAPRAELSEDDQFEQALMNNQVFGAQRELTPIEEMMEQMDRDIAAGEQALAAEQAAQEVAQQLAETYRSPESQGSEGANAPSATVSCPTVGTPIYRVFGGDARGMGSYWTTADPATTPNFRAAAGLPNENAGTWVVEGTINDMTGVQVSTAAPGPTTLPGQPMVPQVQFQPGTASSQVTVNAVYNVETPH